MKRDSHNYFDNVNEYKGLDVAKFFCSILVIMVHIPILDMENGNGITYLFDFYLKNYLSRIAVPFFFVTSGFLLYRAGSKEKLDLIRIKKYCFRIFRLYLLWTVLYFPLSLREITNDIQGIGHGILCFIQRFIFSGSYLHLWYLNALIISVIISALFLYKKVSFYKVFMVSGALYVVGVLTQSWFGLLRPIRHQFPGLWSLFANLGKIIITTRNGLFFGLFFVTLGMYFAFEGITISKELSRKLFILSMGLFFVESTVLMRVGFIRETAQYFFLVPSVIFLFIWLIQIDFPEWSGYVILRRLSSCIYYAHMWVYIITLKTIAVIHMQDISTPAIFLTTLAITIMGSLIVIRLAKFSKFRWLKRLYQ